jgi:hypothetical protein
VGIWIALFEARAYARDVQRARESSLAGVAALRAAAPGTDVILAGALGGAAGAGPDELDKWARGYDLVVYAHQRWACSKGDRGGLEGSWKWSERVTPQVITLDGAEIPIALAKRAAMTGSRFDSPILRQGDGRFCDGLRAGALRAAGYREGDPVCLLGRKASEGYLLVDRIYGGDRDSFIAELQGDADRLRRTGIIFLAVGLLLELIWSGVVLLPLLFRNRGPISDG